FNREMVKLELQADYYAGVFANYVNGKGYLESGDIEEGLRAAAGVGDDRLQEMQGGRANPDTFQHGTSEQRSSWFRRGVEFGDLEHGNTFSYYQ
ncbi:metalloprotease, partial [Rhodovulum adriaticum]|nr:metalloprotease [Rhodovulum adriaticum]